MNGLELEIIWLIYYRYIPYTLLHSDNLEHVAVETECFCLVFGVMSSSEYCMCFTKNNLFDALVACHWWNMCFWLIKLMYCSIISKVISEKCTLWLKLSGQHIKNITYMVTWTLVHCWFYSFLQKKSILQQQTFQWNTIIIAYLKITTLIILMALYNVSVFISW